MVSQLLLLPCKEQRIQHNRWLYSVKIVGYREQKKPDCVVHRIGENKGVPTDLCMYNCVCVCVLSRNCINI